MENICAVVVRFFRWVKVRCLSSLRCSFGVDRRYVAWYEAVQEVQWNEWLCWQTKYDIEERRRLGEVVYSRLMLQIFNNNL